jgi:hypothetical protein
MPDADQCAACYSPFDYEPITLAGAAVCEDCYERALGAIGLL